MTLASATNKWTYLGNGTTATYSYTKKIFVDTDLILIVKDSDNNETTLTFTTDYTVTGVGNVNGGTIILVDAGQAWIDAGGFFETGWTIVIKRVRSIIQETDIRNQGAYYRESIEDEFDKQIMIDQQQQEELDRSVKLAKTIEGGIEVTLPHPETDAYIGWNITADELINKVPTSLSDSGPTINTGDAAKIVNVNSAENAYQLTSFKAMLEAITSGGLSFNTALIVYQKLGMENLFNFKKNIIASATGLTLDGTANFYSVTGTTNITSIYMIGDIPIGTILFLRFIDVLTLVDGVNLKLHGDFITYNEATITLISDGSIWYELSRSIKNTELIVSEMIIVWKGAISAIPSGWVICDGNNSTPDMIDRFMIHADADAAGTNNVGDTGGASTHQLSEAEMPAHNHSSTLGTTDGAGTNVDRADDNVGTYTTGSKGGDTAHTNRDKFRAHAYIMKT